MGFQEKFTGWRYKKKKYRKRESDALKNGKKENCWCMIGGINHIANSYYSTYNVQQYHFIIRFLMQSVHEQLPQRFREYGDYCGIITWNDDSKTTFSMVKKVLAKAQASLEETA